MRFSIYDDNSNNEMTISVGRKAEHKSIIYEKTFFVMMLVDRVQNLVRLNDSRRFVSQPAQQHFEFEHL